MYMLEERGYPRDHDVFKEVWGVAYKGAYFAFVSWRRLTLANRQRNKLDGSPLDKDDVRDIVGRHLDMYLPPPLPVEASDEPEVAEGSRRRRGSDATQVSETGEGMDVDEGEAAPQSALMRTPERN